MPCKSSVENALSSEKFQFLQSKLEKNESYFQSWMGDFSLEGRSLQSFKRYFSKEPRHYEDDIKNNFDVWKIQTYRETISPLVEAFLGISFENKNLATSNVSWVEKVVKHCVDKSIFSEEHGKGITYLCSLLKIHVNLKFATLKEEDYKLFMSCSFDDLSNQGKTMVLLTKCKLAEVFEKGSSIILKQIVDLDPQNWLWTWKLFSELKANRKDEVFPSEEEMNAISRSIMLSKLSFKKYHLLCICDLCEILAEILDHRVLNSLPNTTLDFDSKSFRSNEDVLEFIGANANDAFKNQNKTYLEASIIRSYGTIFSKTLPPKFQDLDLAKKYNRQYLKIIHENCDDKPENKRFLMEHNRIYLDLIENIQLLLKFPVKNSEALDKVFTTVWENEHWKEHEEYSLHFFHGCYFSIEEDVQNALVHWLKMDFDRAAAARCPPSFVFIDFAYILRIKLHNCWSENINLHLDKVLKEICKRLCQSDLPMPEKEKLKTLKRKLELQGNHITDFELMSDLKKTINKMNLKDLSSEELENGNLTVISHKDVQDLSEEMKKCETYFIHWLGDYDVTKEKLAEMTAKFHRKSLKTNYLTQESLEEQCFVHKKTILQMIITFLVEAFLNISFGNPDLGTKNISWVEYAVNYCVAKAIFSEDYAVGFTYICSLLKIHSNLKCGMTVKCDHKKFSSITFESLPSTGRAIVYYAKYVLNSLLTEIQTDPYPILKEMVKLDAKNWVWNWKLFVYLNFLRLENKISLPSEEEIEAVSKAMELNVSTKGHSLCVSAVCDTLAAIVADRIRSGLPNTEIHIGDKVFKSNEDAVNFIKRKAREILTNKSIENQYNQLEIIERYAKIFKFTLPFEISDTDLAKQCKTMLIKLMPHNEYREYKIFLLESQKNYRESINIIQRLMEYPEKNSKKLFKIFLGVWEQTDNWKEHEAYCLHFLHGCFLLMKEDVDNALIHWLQMNFQCDIDMKFLLIDFAILPRIKLCYDWSDQFHFGKAHEEILKRLNENGIPASERAQMTVLKQKIENSMKMNDLDSQKSKLGISREIISHSSSSSGVTVTAPDIRIEDQEIHLVVDSSGKPTKTSCVISKKEAEHIQSELERCETYFLNWFGDNQITVKKLLSMTESLYEVIAQPDQQTEEELKEDFSRHSMLTFQNTIAPLVEAFLNIIGGNIELARKNISWVEFVVKHCVEEDIFSEEYAEGIKYLCSLVRIHAKLKLEDVTKNDYRNVNFSVENLTDKGKSMVFVAKWILNEQIHDRKNAAVHDLKKVVSLDINNWIWNYVLCNRIRFFRRQDRYSGPDEDEMNAIARAVDNSFHDPPCHAMCVSGLCQCLAEIMNDRFYKNLPNTSVNIGTKIFPSNEEVVDYIKSEARDAFKGKTFGFPEAIRYGELFSSLLPLEHRDYELAEKCYKLCLESGPSNSKANHRMGTLQLTGKGDVQKAVHYFKRAIECTTKNFPAWIDLIQTLIGSPRENKTEIEKSFKTFWEQEEYWSEKDKFSIHFLEGCYFAMKKEIQRAVSHWLQHNSYTPASDRVSGFHELERISKRHKWKQSATINLENIIEEIERQMGTASFEVTEKLKLLKLKVENEIYRKNCRYEYSSTAGSTYASTSRRHSNWQSRNTVADKVSSWRTSSLPEASNDIDHFVPQPVAPPTNRYIPPHLRSRQDHSSRGREHSLNQGGWR